MGEWDKDGQQCLQFAFVQLAICMHSQFMTTQLAAKGLRERSQLGLRGHFQVLRTHKGRQRQARVAIRYVYIWTKLVPS